MGWQCKRISPEIQKFELALSDQLKAIHTNLDEVQNLQEMATTNLNELREKARLYLLIAKAQAYDRSAFFELYRITNSPLMETAVRARGILTMQVPMTRLIIENTRQSGNLWGGNNQHFADRILQ